MAIAAAIATFLISSNFSDRALEIIRLNPSREELEVAMAYLADMTDIMGEERQPLSGCPANIHEIVTQDETFEIGEAVQL